MRAGRGADGGGGRRRRRRCRGGSGGQAGSLHGARKVVRARGNGAPLSGHCKVQRRLCIQHSHSSSCKGSSGGSGGSGGSASSAPALLCAAAAALCRGRSHEEKEAAEGEVVVLRRGLLVQALRLALQGSCAGGSCKEGGARRRQRRFSALPRRVRGAGGQLRSVEGAPGGALPRRGGGGGGVRGVGGGGGAGSARGGGGGGGRRGTVPRRGRAARAHLAEVPHELVQHLAVRAPDGLRGHLHAGQHARGAVQALGAAAQVLERARLLQRAQQLPEPAPLLLPALGWEQRQQSLQHEGGGEGRGGGRGGGRSRGGGQERSCRRSRAWASRPPNGRGTARHGPAQAAA